MADIGASGNIPLGLFPGEDAETLAMLEAMGVDPRAMRSKALRANGGGAPAPVARTSVPMSQPTVTFREQSAAPRQVVAGPSPAQSVRGAAPPTSEYDAILNRIYPQEGAEVARERAARLRGQRALGFLGVLSGDEPLGQLGKQTLAESAEEEQRALAQGETRRGAQLRFALEEAADKRRVSERAEAKEERAAAREAAREEREAGRDEMTRRFGLQQAGALRDDYEKLTAGARKEQLAATKILDATLGKPAADMTPAEQWAIVVEFNRVLDPNSVVRESEIQAVQQLASARDQLGAQIAAYKTGQRIPPKLIEQMQALARRYSEISGDVIGELDARYTDLAQRSEVDPTLVVRPKKRTAGAAKGPSGTTRETLPGGKVAEEWSDGS